MQYNVESILPVIVIYNERIRESQSLMALDAALKDMQATLDVVIYDNSKVGQLDSYRNELSNLIIHYFHDASNPGVSSAYNHGATIADKLNKSFLFLLDQDTSFPTGLLSAFVNAINTFGRHALFAPILKSNGKIFSPCRYYFKRGSHFESVNPGINKLANVNFLNSGLLINLSAFKQIGGYDAHIRLYFSDFDFIDRLKKHHKEYILVNITCEHELASNENKDLSKALYRFNIYCSDGRAAAKDLFSWVIYAGTIISRSVKLSLRFKNNEFLSIFWKRFMLQQKMSGK